MNCLTAMVITKKDGAGFIIKTKGLKMKVETGHVKVFKINGENVREVVDYGNVVIWTSMDKKRVYIVDSSGNVLCSIYGEIDHEFIINRIYDYSNSRGIIL